MSDIAQFKMRLERYLEVERLLNTFFSAFDYCLPKCILPELQKGAQRTVAACCTQRFYASYDVEHPAFEMLKSERERIFGKPGDHSWPHPVSPCEYHNPQAGCLLASHKSPVCLAFMCPEAIDVMRNEYGIYVYDVSGVYYALEWILTGDFTQQQYNHFSASILHMTERIGKRKM